MRRRTRIFAALLGTAIVALAVGAGSASASFHLMKIRAVFLGPPGDSFVELQMTADGQNFVNGQKIDIYNATATGLHPTYILNHDVASGHSSSDAPTVAQAYATIRRATVTGGATTGSIGTPARA